MSLKKQTFSGVKWTFVDTFLIKGLLFIAVIYIAKLIGPEEFGVFGMMAIFIGIGTSLVDSGLSSSIIRSDEIDQSDLNTVFISNFSISFIVYLIVYLAAPTIATFFSTESLIPLLRIYCLIFIINAFSAIQLAQLNRSMGFDKIAKYNLPGVFLGIIVGVYFSLKGSGVWSLVYLYLTIQGSLATILWLKSPWKPSLIFSKEKFKKHFYFGYRLMLSGLLDKVFTNIYNVVIGRFFSTISLGFFERARTFNNYPVTTITGIVSRVTYPLFSQIKNEKEKLAGIYKRILQITFFITAPLMLGLSAIAHPMFLVVLGEKWQNISPYFQILALGGLLFPLQAYNLNILKVYGRSDMFLKLEIVKKVILVIILILFFRFGIFGILWASVLSSYISYFINSYYSGQLIGYSTKKQVTDISLIFVLAIFSGCLMYLCVYLLQEYHPILQIFVAVIVGLIFYLTTSFIFKIPVFNELKIMLKEKNK